MIIPPSSLFNPVDLAPFANIGRHALPEDFAIPDIVREAENIAAFRGIPFNLGAAGRPNAILLDKEPVAIPLNNCKAACLVFLHIVETRNTVYQKGFADDLPYGNDLGDLVSEYALDFADGETHTHPILRRFAIQQSLIGWGASAFAAAPLEFDSAYRSHSEDHALGKIPAKTWGWGECRAKGARKGGKTPNAWLYALPNPSPAKEIKALRLVPREERSIVFGISCTAIEEHPLRLEQRRKLLLTLPEGARLNAIGEYDGLAIDMGEIISARQQFVYDHEQWSPENIDVQPAASENKVVVEYTAHPRAKLYVDTGNGDCEVHELQKLTGGNLVEVSPAHRAIKIKIVDKHSRQPVGVRLHIHGEAGEYLPPRGHHRKVNTDWFEDNYAEFANYLNQYAYVDGACEVDVPLGPVYLDVTRGYEIAPVRRRFDIAADTDSLVIELERVLDWRGRGWVSADTHVHFLSPSTAVLEGSAEDVNVVNLLASQWGEMFSNVGDFDGRTTYGSVQSGNSGEFLVRVGSENRMNVLGHISLLGYSGELIHPLCTGGPGESALGDPQEVTMAQWAQRCIDQGGLVVMPHAPNPQCERAADIVLGLVNAVEMMIFNPYKGQISPYGLADLYRYYNLGYHLPVVGGSDKMSAASLLGGVRTYTHLGERGFNYENWMDALRAGNTFVTIGPLVEFSVEGKPPGSVLNLPPSGGTVNVSWKVESVRVPIEEIEIVAGGLVQHQSPENGSLSASGGIDLKIGDSAWLALRVRGSYRGEPADVAAHSSAVQVIVGDKPLFSPQDAAEILRQIEGSMAYIDTIATRPHADRYRRLRATLESAHNRLHQRMHSQGVYHRHVPLHDHSEHHEH